jgi:lipopolysaccharide/colanic/teichoic acid biosynthesis glycosyltransferase
MDRRGYFAAKRTLDLVLGTTALVALSPLMLVVGAAIRMDSPGPILFRQARLGKHGREFTLLKFRSMNANASVVIGRNNVVENPLNDPRVTRVGRLLRRTSVDEIPQLINVVIGDMSLVGPRPDLPIALTMYTSRQAHKLDVLPGITGLAQVSGRNLLSGAERWELDVQYSEAANLALDLRILAKTIWKVLGQEGVYAS